MQMEEKSRASTLLEKKDSVIAVARDIGVTREAINQLKRSVAPLPAGTVLVLVEKLWRSSEWFFHSTAVVVG